MSTISAAPPLQLHDVEYAQRGSHSLRFDASIPVSSKRAPAAIIVHGGAWVRGDRRVNVQPLFQPLNDAGFAWFSISYSLATDPFQIGAAVVDVEAAILFIRHRAAEYGIDPDRIVLIGESAGGQLAAMAALGRAAGNAVKAVVAFYAPTDLVSLARTSTFIPEAIRRQLNGTPWESLIRARLALMSPLAAIHKDMPPFLFIHGDNDHVVPLEQSRLMCDRIRENGTACKLVTVSGGGHGLRWWEGSPSQSEPYKRELTQWLKQQMDAVATPPLP